MVYDVWDSQEDFDAFGQTLMPILAELGPRINTPAAAASVGRWRRDLSSAEADELTSVAEPLSY
jgi:hypothetical protein